MGNLEQNMNRNFQYIHCWVKPCKLNTYVLTASNNSAVILNFIYLHADFLNKASLVQPFNVNHPVCRLQESLQVLSRWRFPLLCHTRHQELPTERQEWKSLPPSSQESSSAWWGSYYYYYKKAALQPFIRKQGFNLKTILVSIRKYKR